MPRVSVIVPTYNHGRFVRSTLRSVLCQTFRDFEIIVVDDGSSDATIDVVGELARDGAVRLLRQSHAGQAAARNRGLAESRGEFVAFLDDDDLWPPDKLQWQVGVLRSDPSTALIGGSAELIDEGGNPIDLHAPPRGPVAFRDLFRRCPFWSPGQTLIRREAIVRAGGLSNDLPGVDDYDLWFRLARTAPLRTDPRVALRYRIHAGNASRDRTKMFERMTRVAARHLAAVDPRERPVCRRLANRWAYDYIGTECVAKAKSAARRGDVGGIISSIRDLAKFAPAALADPALVLRIAFDLLPARLSELARGAGARMA